MNCRQCTHRDAQKRHFCPLWDLQPLSLPPKGTQDEQVNLMLARQLGERHACGLTLLLIPANPLHGATCVIGHALNTGGHEVQLDDFTPEVLAETAMHGIHDDFIAVPLCHAV